MRRGVPPVVAITPEGARKKSVSSATAKDAPLVSSAPVSDDATSWKFSGFVP